MKRKLNSALAASLMLAMLAGCKKEQPPAPPSPPPKAKPAPTAAPPAPAVQKQLSSNVQQPGGNLEFGKRTDPFKPFAQAPAVPAAPAPGAAAPARSGDFLPIQSFEVSKFKVVGIVAGLKENRALLVDPAGKGYVVAVGTQIGPNDGRITRITPSAVEVVERYRQENGRYKKRKVVLPLAKKR
jgi:type IV pilus assembly protein PilP